jgi:hypothetical protein
LDVIERKGTVGGAPGETKAIRSGAVLALLEAHRIRGRHKLPKRVEVYDLIPLRLASSVQSVISQRERLLSGRA